MTKGDDMKVLVQHMIQNNVTGDVEGYRDVAEVDASACDDVNDALEYAYRYTNNVNGSWSIKERILPLRDGSGMVNYDFNENVTVLYNRPDGMGQRSSMMGDRFIVDGVMYKCMAFGFKKVEMEAA